MFIEIKNTDVDSGIENTEIIRLDNLLKMYKEYGNMGDGIAFEFMDPVINERRTFVARYKSTSLRDKAWDDYNEQLYTVGAYIATATEM